MDHKPLLQERPPAYNLEAGQGDYACGAPGYGAIPSAPPPPPYPYLVTGGPGSALAHSGLQPGRAGTSRSPRGSPCGRQFAAGRGGSLLPLRAHVLPSPTGIPTPHPRVYSIHSRTVTRYPANSIVVVGGCPVCR